MDHMKLAVLSLMLVLVVLAGFSTSAGASSSSRLGVKGPGSFCGVARSVARGIVNSTAIANGQVVPANVKVIYEKIAAAEPALLSAAAGLAPYAPTLIARARAIQKPLHALKVYFKTTCKLNL
jgi:hypothetical protein